MVLIPKPEPWLKPRPRSDLGCLICAEFARRRFSTRTISYHHGTTPTSISTRNPKPGTPHPTPPQKPNGGVSTKRKRDEARSGSDEKEDATTEDDSDSSQVHLDTEGFRV